MDFSAQVTIFSEDFETASGPENQATPYIGWQTGQFTTTPPTNDNYWWVFDNTRCTVINGNYSMAVSQNNPETTGTLPQYRSNKVASTLVYSTIPIDASNYTSLTLDFNWICQGEVGFDFGTVLYSLDGNTWAALPGFYEGQSTVQNVVGLDLSVVDGQQFYLGFGWDNDNSIGNAPAFTIDDIIVKGTPLPVCSIPTNQPTNLSLSATGDSINGSFTAASPAPDNYLVVISTSTTPPIPVDGTSYAVGDTIGLGTVVDIDSNTSFTATGLSASTTYYLYVFSYNSLCANGPLYTSLNPLTNSLTTANIVYCNALTTNTASTKYINDVGFLGTLNDVTNYSNSYSTSPNGYQNWTGLPNAIQAQGEGVNVYIGSSTGRGRWKAWIDWNKNGSFSDAGELVYDTGNILTSSTTFGFVIPTNQTVGDYRIRIRLHNAYRNTGAELGSYDYSPCATFGAVAGGNSYGETEDYLFTVIENCSAKITSITNGETCGEGTVDLQVAGAPGVTQYRWYDSETGGNLIATTTANTWSPFISNTTTFWVTAYNGSCESVSRTKIIGYVNPITTLSFTPETPSVCGVNDIIEISATGETELAYLIDEDFETGGLGVFTNVNTDANAASIDLGTIWQNETSTYIPNSNVWFPAISSGFGSNNFVLTNYDSDAGPPTDPVENSLTLTNSINSSTFQNLTLEFKAYYSRYTPDNTTYTNNGSPLPEYLSIQVSTDGGNNWTDIDLIEEDLGIGTQFITLQYNLDSYINQSNLKIRIRSYAWASSSLGWLGGGAAIDDVQLYGTRPLNPAFTWSGSPAVDAYTDPAATIPYVAGNAIGTVYVKPTLAQLELPEFTFTATATLSNGCDIVKDITIENNTKIWQGNSSLWTQSNNWKPSGVPNSSNCIIIPSTPFDAEINGSTDANGYSLTILNGGILSVFPGGTITTQDFVDVNTGGLFELQGLQQDAAQLIQVNDVSNTGNITLNRQTNVRLQDYVYWSSPVENYNISNIGSSLMFYWIPTIGGNPGQHGNWATAGGTMAEGKGYAVRGPSGNGNTSSTATWQNIIFTGVPHNGDVTIGINRGTYTGPNIGGGGGQDPITNEDDNWNLIGNPYPSSLNATAFLNNPANNDIDGAIYLWTHGTSIFAGGTNSPFYGTYVYNYNRNLDYLTYTDFGGTQSGFDGMIGSGQGFFVKMSESSSGTSSTVTFTNAMRNAIYRNDQFFRNAESEMERHRIWLDLVTPTENVNRTLLGYADGATLEADRNYDASIISGNGQHIYSLINNKPYIIQARPTPFDSSDSVPLGIFVNEIGQHTIAINHLDGLFETTDQGIFLEDLETGIMHNLKQSPYFFSVNELGTHDQRFKLKYTNNTLGVDDLNTVDISIIAPNNSYIKVSSGTSQIDSIMVHDLLGRVLIDHKDINAQEFVINEIPKAAGTYIVKATLLNGREKIQKVILK